MADDISSQHARGWLGAVVGGGITGSPASSLPRGSRSAANTPTPPAPTRCCEVFRSWRRLTRIWRSQETIEYTDVPVDANWESVPAFGDYRSIARYDRQGADQ